MRVKRGQHAVDGILDQLFFFRRRHILGAHAFEDVAEDGKLPVGLCPRRIGGASIGVDRAYGCCAHQCANRQKCHLTYHCLPFSKTYRLSTTIAGRPVDRLF